MYSVYLRGNKDVHADILLYLHDILYIRTSRSPQIYITHNWFSHVIKYRLSCTADTAVGCNLRKTLNDIHFFGRQSVYIK